MQQRVAVGTVTGYAKKIRQFQVRLEVFTEVEIKVMGFWNMTPSSLADECKYFGGYFLRLRLKIEAVCSFETLMTTCQAIRCHNPQVYNLILICRLRSTR
jgi:hypothetical protein